MTSAKEEAVPKWWEHYLPKDQLVHLLAGGIAGGVSRTCVSPLERVKMLLQVRVKAFLRKSLKINPFNTSFVFVA
jgi:hypothetical protein